MLKIKLKRKNKMKYSLFAIKLNEGYGLFQEYIEQEYSTPHIIYRKTINHFSKDEIEKALQGDYYYQKVGFGLWAISKILKKNKNKELNCGKIHPNGDFIETFEDINMIYLGDFNIPKQVEPIKFYRRLGYINKKQHSWVLIDAKTESTIKSKGKTLIYTELNPEIEKYPAYNYVTLSKLKNYFEIEFKPEDFNDEYIKSTMTIKVDNNESANSEVKL